METMKQLAIFVTLLLTATYYHVAAQSRTNFKIKRFEIRHVDPTHKVSINITEEKDKQYCSYDVTLPMPLDEHVGVVVDIASMLSNKTVVHLFTIREKYMCKAANQFLGEFWYDILRAAQVTPGVCPIRSGRYHGHHIYLNYRKITLQTFPFGTLRFLFRVKDDRRPKDVLVDILMVVENMTN